MPVSPRYSIVVYGATGFTGRFVVQHLASQVHELQRDVPGGFTWALGGRNSTTLNRFRAELEEEYNLGIEASPGVVVADTKDALGLQKMAEGARLVMNCVGPYAFLGEAVVKAVVTANDSLAQRREAPTDYIDLSGEPAWIEEMVLRYGDRAKRQGAAIIHAAAFDSVPADMGILQAKKQLLAKGAVPTSAEAFVRLKGSFDKGMGIHYATYEAAINGFSTRKHLSAVRKQLYSKLPRPKPQPVEHGLSSGLPSRPGRFGGAINYAPDQGVYLIPFFFADPAIVRLSQSLQASLGQDVPPVQFAFWIAIPSLPVLIVLTLALVLFGLLAQFSIGRTLLLRYPRIFTAGMVSHEGPTKEQRDASSFSTTIVMRGYSKFALSRGDAQGPDTRTVVRVTGPEIGYVSTPILFVAVARTILKERSAVASGVLTPAAALGKTALLDDLNHEHKVRFAVVEK